MEAKTPGSRSATLAAAASPRAAAQTYLFVPGNHPQRFDKACASGADAVILDLEDAVAPVDKNAARTAVAAWLQADRQVIIRVNAADSEWYSDDLALCGQAGVAGIMLPKAESVSVLRALAARLPDMPLLPLIETARGLSIAEQLAACPQVERLVFGSIDFQHDLGIDGDDDELLYFRSAIVLASRVAGIAAPIDGVTLSVADPERAELDARRARRLGFGGKLCIHPSQVMPVQAAFSPTDADLAWATRVVAAAAYGGGACQLDNQMIDLPVILRAEALLRKHAARLPAEQRR